MTHHFGLTLSKGGDGRKQVEVFGTMPVQLPESLCIWVQILGLFSEEKCEIVPQILGFRTAF